MSAAATLDPSQELERATSDYLAVSRNAHLYGTPAEYDRAEARAWERVLAAQVAVATAGGS